jgi:hypothetical protein
MIWSNRNSSSNVELNIYRRPGILAGAKRLSKGKFDWWSESNAAAKPLEASEAQLLAEPYRTFRFDALAPKPRQDRGQSGAITPQLADLIERLKHESPHRTGTMLLRELALSSGQNEPAISASTLHRFLKRPGLSEEQLLAPQARRKFEAEHNLRHGKFRS